MGRTGCFIVIDAMLERIKHEKTVDIYGHVTLMRSQRNYMVQTEDQYSFIHDALLEAVACGNTEVAARSLYSYIQKLAQVESGEHVTGMELEFKVERPGNRTSKSIDSRFMNATFLAPLLSPIFYAHLKVSHHKSVMGKFFRLIAMVGDVKTVIKVVK